MIQYRNVIDRTDNNWEYGHREESRDGGPWVRSVHSNYMRDLSTYWFQKHPQTIMREHLGFDTTIERANEFEQASDGVADVWFYLAAAAPPHTGDEALKWIMGALAAELNTRGLRFVALPAVLPARHLNEFVTAITDGRIDRTFTKAIMAEMLKPDWDGDLMGLINQPRFRAISVDDLEPIVDRVIAENPDQFEKAKTNPRLVQFFVGQVMKATQGKAPPAKVTEIMNGKLGL